MIFRFFNLLARQKFILASGRGIIRKKYNIADDKKILLSVGRLEPEKDFANLISIVDSLKREDLILIIVGDGSQKEALSRLIKDKELEKKVILAGFQGREKIWDFYHDADIFILLSRSEGLGLVFWEAMYMEVPLIGTPIDGIKETIGDDGERGFYWKNNEKELKNKINFCLDDGNNERKLMIERAKDYVNQKMESKVEINNLLN